MISTSIGEINIEINDEGLMISKDDDHLHSICIHKSNLANFVEYLNSSIEQDLDDKRIGFRVPIYQLSANSKRKISVVIESLGSEQNLSLVDFSLCGMLVKSEEKLTLSPKSKETAIIKHAENNVAIGAKLVRETENKKYAFHFPSAVKDGELDPSDALVKVFRSLEFEWLRQRVVDR